MWQTITLTLGEGRWGSRALTKVRRTLKRISNSDWTKEANRSFCRPAWVRLHWQRARWQRYRNRARWKWLKCCTKLYMLAACLSLRHNRMWVTIQKHKLHMTPLWGPLPCISSHKLFFLLHTWIIRIHSRTICPSATSILYKMSCVPQNHYESSSERRLPAFDASFPDLQYRTIMVMM